MSEEELIAEFGEDGWYELEDEIYRRYSFTPISLPFMIICIRSFMTIMCFRQMKLRSWYQKKTGLLGTSITCKMYEDRQIVLYDYQPSRNASHPRDFLKKFKGVCVTDGYQVYHTIEKEREDMKITGCWAHARRRFDESVKALPKDKKKSSLAYLALKQIQAIYREENKLADESAEERLSHRQLTVKPLVDAYFA